MRADGSKDSRPASRRSRCLRRALLVIVGLWAVAAAWLLGTAWYRVGRLAPAAVPAEVSRILSAAEYDTRISSHRRPYVFALESPSGGAVAVFGAEHTQRRDDPQLARIRALWQASKPSVALVESDLGMLFPAFMDPVETFGEVGYVHALARENGVPTYSWEPRDEVLIADALAQGFSRQQVALRWILTPYFSTLRHGKPSKPEAFVLDTLEERCSVKGLDRILASIEAIDAAWRREFADGPDWRDVSDEFGLPGVLGRIDLNLPRDRHLVACIAELVRKGERVFVICGSSHAVKIEPALDALCAK